MSDGPRPRCYVSVAYTHAASDPRVRRHCEAMARRGWRVVQLGLAPPGGPAVRRLGDVVLVGWRRRRYRGAGLLRYARAYLGFFLWTRAMLRRITAERDVRLVQINNVPVYLVWTARVVRARGGRVVLDIHDPEPELLLSKLPRRPGVRLLARAAAFGERAAARRADRVLTVHEQHRLLTVRHGVAPEKLRVVVNSPDDQLFPLLPPRAPNAHIGYHGTVARRMGLDVVLHAARALGEGGIDLKVTILGDGDDVTHLQALRDELRLGERVSVTGERVPPESLRRRLDRFGIGLVPLRRDPITDIMLPTKLLEYVRLGIPVLVAWTPTIAEYFPDSCVNYVEHLSVESLVTVIRGILDDRESARRRAVSAQALPIIRSWQEQGERAYVSLMEEVAAGAN